MPREPSTGRPGQGTPGEGVLGFSRRDLCLSSFALNYFVVRLMESRLILGFCFDPCSLLAGPIVLVEGVQEGVGGRGSTPAASSLEPSMGMETVEDDVEISKPISKFTVLEPGRACRELSAGKIRRRLFLQKGGSILPGTSCFLVCSVLNFVTWNFFHSEIPMFITQTGIILLTASNS